MASQVMASQATYAAAVGVSPTPKEQSLAEKVGLLKAGMEGAANTIDALTTRIEKMAKDIEAIDAGGHVMVSLTPGDFGRTGGSQFHVPGMFAKSYLMAEHRKMSMILTRLMALAERSTFLSPDRVSDICVEIERSVTQEMANGR